MEKKSWPLSIPHSFVTKSKSPAHRRENVLTILWSVGPHDFSALGLTFASYAVANRATFYLYMTVQLQEVSLELTFKKVLFVGSHGKHKEKAGFPRVGMWLIK